MGVRQSISRGVEELGGEKTHRTTKNWCAVSGGFSIRCAREGRIGRQQKKCVYERKALSKVAIAIPSLGRCGEFLI